MDPAKSANFSRRLFLQNIAKEKKAWKVSFLCGLPGMKRNLTFSGALLEL